MCGFAGFIGSPGPNATHEATAKRMADAILHRGPDDSGTWSDPDAGIALGHRRLSIVDLSPAGHQPMISRSGRFVIAFNGEVYNHQDIRRELEASSKAPVWRGHSDTEVMLAAIESLGIKAALEKFVGMFAFALWDRHERRLTLARDRVGEKPLYYGANNGVFLFGSDLAALRQHPAWRADINRDALALMLRYNHVPAPFSIYSGISKLEPGSYLEAENAGRELRVTRYWSGPQTIADGTATPFTGSPDEAVRETEKLLKQSIAGQMLADVPLGAFLSGGIDSSTVVALMQNLSTRPVKTFSIGFNEPDYDEAPHAKAVARHLGTDHTELYLSDQDALATVPRLAGIYSEPFADSSQIPTFLVAQLARQHVTVALSGDGGDELFSGYSRYAMAGNAWKRMNAMPAPLRRAAVSAMTSLSPQTWNRLALPARAVLPASKKMQRAGDQIHKLASVLQCASLDEVYLRFISHWTHPSELLIRGREPDLAFATDARITALSAMRRMMTRDLTGYLPDDILVKVDRASMSVSLEARVPMLDHRLIEFSATLPESILRHNGQSKWPLRQILQRYVPSQLIDRPKMGFGVPIDSWLRGPLRDWAEALLDERRLRQEGYFNPAPIRQAWADHLSGTRNMQHPLWVILMFQAWREALAGAHR